MNLTAEQIQDNWNQFISNIEEHISSPRKEKLVEFYEKYAERVMLMPAAHKKEYHNAFPGGYVEHVNRVVAAALRLYDVWSEFEMDRSTFTIEELVFAAINHDLGKIGDENHESYLPQTDTWRKDKLGEDYMFNKELAFASVPDRGLFMLQSHGIQYSFNEMLGIQTHDGLYDDANKKYLMSYMPESRPRSSMPFILHQADLLAARVEFEREWLPKFKNPVPSQEKNFTLGDKPRNAQNKQQKALGSIKSEGLKNLLDSI
jgi:hypothetical protein